MGQRSLTAAVAAVFSFQSVCAPLAQASSTPQPHQKTVFHIQDIHKNLEAQRDIAKMISTLAARDSVGVIGLEGAFSELPIDKFRRFPDQAAVRAAARALFLQGDISGPVYGALASAALESSLIGIDNRDRYEANVEAYRQSIADKSHVKQAFERANDRLERQKRHVFNDALLAFDRRVNARRAGRMTLGAYANGLRAEELSAFPQLRLFRAALALESVLDFERLEKERASILSRLTPKSNHAQVNALIARSTGYQNYLCYLALSERIDVKKLFDEIGQSEDAGYVRLARTDEEKRLIEQSKRLYLTGKLVDFSLTPEEWKKLNAISSKPLAAEENIYGLELSLQPYIRFYREADARNAHLARNMLEAMVMKKTNTGILVAGGFHTVAIDDALRKAGVRIVTLTPKITKVESADGARYLTAFNQRKTPLDRLFEGRDLFTAPDPMPQSLLTGGVIGMARGSDGASLLPSHVQVRIAHIGVTTLVEMKNVTGREVIRVDQRDGNVAITKKESIVDSSGKGQWILANWYMPIADWVETRGVVYGLLAISIFYGWGWMTAAPFLFLAGHSPRYFYGLWAKNPDHWTAFTPTVWFLFRWKIVASIISIGVVTTFDTHSTFNTLLFVAVVLLTETLARAHKRRNKPIDVKSPHIHSDEETPSAIASYVNSLQSDEWGIVHRALGEPKGDQDYLRRLALLRLVPLHQPGILTFAIRGWAGLSKEDKIVLLRLIVKRNHEQKDDDKRAVVLHPGWDTAREMRITLVPRMLDLDPKEDLNRQIEQYFVLQRNAIPLDFKGSNDSFFKIIRTHFNRFMVRWWPFRTMSATINPERAKRGNSDKTKKPNAPKPVTAPSCVFCPKTGLERHAHQLGIRYMGLVTYFNFYPAFPISRWGAPENEQLQLVMTWGEDEPKIPHEQLAQRELLATRYLRTMREFVMQLNASPSLIGRQKYRFFLNGADYGKPEANGGFSVDHIHGHAHRLPYDFESASVTWDRKRHSGYAGVRVGMAELLPAPEDVEDAKIGALTLEASGKDALALLDGAVNVILDSVSESKDSFNVFYFDVLPWWIRWPSHVGLGGIAEWIWHHLLISPGLVTRRVRVFITGRTKAISALYDSKWGTPEVLGGRVILETSTEMRTFRRLIGLRNGFLATLAWMGLDGLVAALQSLSRLNKIREYLHRYRTTHADVAYTIQALRETAGNFFNTDPKRLRTKNSNELRQLLIENGTKFMAEVADRSLTVVDRNNPDVEKYLTSKQRVSPKDFIRDGTTLSDQMMDTLLVLAGGDDVVATAVDTFIELQKKNPALKVVFFGKDAEQAKESFLTNMGNTAVIPIDALFTETNSDNSQSSVEQSLALMKEKNISFKNLCFIADDRYQAGVREMLLKQIPLKAFSLLSCSPRRWKLDEMSNMTLGNYFKTAIEAYYNRHNDYLAGKAIYPRISIPMKRYAKRVALMSEALVDVEKEEAAQRDRADEGGGDFQFWGMGGGLGVLLTSLPSVLSNHLDKTGLFLRELPAKQVSADPSAVPFPLKKAVAPNLQHVHEILTGS